MIQRRDLVWALQHREQISDWVIVERAQEVAIVDEATRLSRAEQRTRWKLTVHIDVATGRGSAHVAIDALDGTADAIVDQAITLALSAVGPEWTNVAPAAPAKVTLLDPTLAAGDPLDAADNVLRTLRRPKSATTQTRVTVLREHVAADARNGFRAEWLASLVRAEALVTGHDRSLGITREARQLMDLDLDAAVAAAAGDLDLLAAAGPPTAGPCAIVLDAEAMLHGGLGVWAAFEDQGDAIVERQGLTRYREGAVIAPGADQVAEPLTVTSDGALEYGVRSAPVGDEGDAVRRFALVDRGIAAGLGLSPREAALRKRDPNGGVRNLVVAGGTWSGAAPAGRVVEIKRLRDLSIDPYTSVASLEIGLGIAGGKPFSGGTVRLDLIAALARAQRSAARVRRGSYFGPSSLLIDRAELIV